MLRVEALKIRKANIKTEIAGLVRVVSIVFPNLLFIINKIIAFQIPFGLFSTILIQKNLCENVILMFIKSMTNMLETVRAIATSHTVFATTTKINYSVILYTLN